MKKLNKKMINVMATAALVTGVVAPIATVPTSVVEAAGAGTITATNVPTVVDGDVQSFGTVRVVVPAGTNMAKNDKLVVRLPYDMLEKYNTGDTYFGAGTPNNVTVPVSFSGNDNAFVVSKAVADNADTHDIDESKAQVNKISAKAVSKSRIEVEFTTDTEVLTEDGVFFINLGSLSVDKGASGAKEATFEASSSSSFPVGKVTIGNVNNSGQLLASFGSLDVSNNNFTPTINLTETVPGSFVKDGEVKIKLPSGYKWQTGSSELVKNSAVKLRGLDVTYGEDIRKNITITLNSAQDEMIITFSGTATKSATKLEIKPDFYVSDDSKVKAGDIIAKISGKSKVDINEGKIGTYGEFGSTVSVDEAPVLVAGKVEQELGKITIKESIGNTLINGRTVNLTLPEAARWNRDTLKEGYKFDTNESVTLEFKGFTGSDDRTARFVVVSATDNSDNATLDLEKVEIAIDPSFEGDLVLKVDGSAGVRGDVKVASVKRPVTVQTSELPNVTIGRSNQNAAEFTIAEQVAGVLEDGGLVEIELPEGAKFVGTPKVEVTEGDLTISSVSVKAVGSSTDRKLVFTVDSESRTASKIKVSGVQLQLDRTLPEGDVKVKIQGSAIIETNAVKYETVEETTVTTKVVPKQNWNEYVAQVAIAKVATPAPGDTTGSAEFVIDSTTYKVNGAEKTLDVAPFIQDGRTFLPVRFVAEALGVSESNIIWNANTKTVTLIKGDRIAQIQLGSSNLVVNGVSVPMDTVAFVKEGRTVLPLRYAAQALGAQVSWDEATRTVKIN